MHAFQDRRYSIEIVSFTKHSIEVPEFSHAWLLGHVFFPVGLAAAAINVKLREMMASGRYGADMRVTMGIIETIDGALM